MSNHTQGPWKKGIWGGSIISESSNGIDINGAIGEEAVKYYGGNLICESASECNRNLIAAAPDLLAALNRLVHLHLCEQEGISSGMPTVEDWYEAVETAEAAIEKAEGGSNE